MATLHIEHHVTDYATWKAAFDRFEAKRAEAGVTAHRIHQPVDDPSYLLAQLDFATVDQARAFLTFLEQRIWPSSPALVGTPIARILVTPA